MNWLLQQYYRLAGISPQATLAYKKQVSAREFQNLFSWTHPMNPGDPSARALALSVLQEENLEALDLLQRRGWQYPIWACEATAAQSTLPPAERLKHPGIYALRECSVKTAAWIFSQGGMSDLDGDAMAQAAIEGQKVYNLNFVLGQRGLGGVKTTQRVDLMQRALGVRNPELVVSLWKGMKFTAPETRIVLGSAIESLSDFPTAPKEKEAAREGTNKILRFLWESAAPILPLEDRGLAVSALFAEKEASVDICAHGVLAVLRSKGIGMDEQISGYFSDCAHALLRIPTVENKHTLQKLELLLKTSPAWSAKDIAAFAEKTSYGYDAEIHGLLCEHSHRWQTSPPEPVSPPHVHESLTLPDMTWEGMEPRKSL